MSRDSDPGGRRATSPGKPASATSPREGKQEKEAAKKPSAPDAKMQAEQKEQKKKDRLSLLQPMKASVSKDLSSVDSRESPDLSANSRLRTSDSSLSKKRLSLPNVPLDPTQKIQTPRNLLDLDAEYEKYRNKWMTDREARRVLAELAQDPTIKLPSRLADVLQITEIDALATHSVTFYAHHCKAWQVLRGILRREIRNTEGVGAVLRGNTLSSKMMTKYVKLAGGTAYLQETFVPLVTKNLSATWVWEQQINQRADITPEEIKKNLASLTSATDEFLNAIVSSMPRLPPMIRSVTEWIAQEVKARFHEEAAAPLRLAVASFFFLRLIGPAISAPETMGVKVQRAGTATPALKNLIAISKIVQQIANGQLFKEDSNQVLNPYVESKRALFDQIVAAFSAPLVPEPTEQPFPATPEELDKCVDFFHATLQKHGQQVVQRIGQGQETNATAAETHFYKLPISVNPSVWFRNVIYGETVLEFGHSSELVRNAGIEQLMQFFSCPPVAASLLKWRTTESDEEGTKCLKGLLTFAPMTNEHFVKGLCEWQVPIPKGPAGEERTWEQWIEACKPEGTPDWKEVQTALRALVKTLLSGNLVMLRVLPLSSPQQIVWFTWMQFLEGAYA